MTKQRGNPEKEKVTPSQPISPKKLEKKAAGASLSSRLLPIASKIDFPR
jgi:hypothetical protein